MTTLLVPSHAMHCGFSNSSRWALVVSKIIAATTQEFWCWEEVDFFSDPINKLGSCWSISFENKPLPIFQAWLKMSRMSCHHHSKSRPLSLAYKLHPRTVDYFASDLHMKNVFFRCDRGHTWSFSSVLNLYSIIRSDILEWQIASGTWRFQV